MIGSFPAECLALATGLFPRRPPTDVDVRRAASIPQKLKAGIRDFMRAEDAEPWEAWKRPPAQADLRDLLANPLEIEEVDTSANPDVIASYIMAVNSARQYLFERWPVYESEGLEPENYDLAEDEYGDIWELVRGLDGIDDFLADLRSHVLSREQVEAFAATYPDTYEAIQQMAVEEAAELRGKRRFSWQQEDMYRILMSIPDMSPIVTQTQPQPSKPPAPTNPQQDKRANQTRTTPERIEANEAR